MVDDPSIVLSKLGPEPFDSQLNRDTFYKMLVRRSRQLKPLSLDQTFIAGLGNIYTDEALFLAGLHPRKPSNSVTRHQSELLLQSIRQMLLDGIKRCGASIDWVYKGGDFQNYFRVYHREGEPCIRCHSRILRTVVGQRCTYYCPQCQPVIDETV